MIWWVMFFVVSFMAMVVVFVFFQDNILRLFRKDTRIKAVSNNAKDNIRLQDRDTNKRYKPVEIEPLGDDLYKIVGEQTSSPFEVKTWQLRTYQFRLDPIHALLDGYTEFWIVPESHFVTHQAAVRHEATSTKHPDTANTGNSSGTVEHVDYNNAHPKYSPAELTAIVNNQQTRITQQEATIKQQNANKRRDVEDMVGYVSQLSSSKSAGIGGKR